MNYTNHLLHCYPSSVGFPWDRSFQPLLRSAAALFPFSHSRILTEESEWPQLSFSYMDNDCNWNVHKQDGFSFRSNSQKLFFTEKGWLIFVFHLPVIVVFFVWTCSTWTNEGKSPLRGLMACCVTHWDCLSTNKYLFLLNPKVYKRKYDLKI